MRNFGKIALVTGAAFMAAAAAPQAFAQGQGNNNNAGGPQASGQGQGQRGGNSGGQGAANQRGGGQSANVQRGNQGGNDQTAGPGNNNRGANNAMPAQRGNGNGNGNAASNRGQSGGAGNARGNAGAAGMANGGGGNNGNPGAANRGAGNPGMGNQGVGGPPLGVGANNRGGPPGVGGVGGGIIGGGDFAFRELRGAFGVNPRIIDGCPPGLAMKRNGCLPPGQARARYRGFDPRFFGLAGAAGGQYFYEDGYLLRYGNTGLAGFLPLLGGALGIGNTWPAAYDYRPLPDYYSGYYGGGDPRGYRYADNVIYGVNPQTSAITSVAGLLMADDFGIGRPMPRGYDVYNVPPAHRGQYFDTPQTRYRYANGYIYEIDPGTSLISSAIPLVR